MPKVNTLMLGLSLCVLPGFVAVIPVFAQETILQQVTVESTISKPATVSVIEESALVRFGRTDFEERLANLNAWIDMGLSKGWLTADKAAAFKSEANRLTDFLAAHSLPNGQMSVSANNILEKQVNVLNADLSTTMTNSGGQVADVGQLQ